MSRLLALGLLVLVASACRASRSDPAPTAVFAANRPERIRALPPIDRVGTEAGVRCVRKSVDEQLARRGYKRERAGRGATLHVVIERWGRVSDGSGGGTPCVELSARLYDDATGASIWEAHGQSGCETHLDPRTHDSWFDGVIDSFVDWLSDSILSWFVDELENTGDEAVRNLIRSLPQAADATAATDQRASAITSGAEP